MTQLRVILVSDLLGFPVTLQLHASLPSLKG